MFYLDYADYAVRFVSNCHYDNFKWMPVEEIDVDKILNVPEDSNIDYFVECDLTIPEKRLF
jgi:hypothetical protein